MIRLAKMTLAYALSTVGEAAVRGSEALLRGDDGRAVRLVPPPKVPRWHIVAVSTYPAGGEQVIGGYRSRRVAAWIADRLPKRTNVRLEVRPVSPDAAIPTH